VELKFLPRSLRSLDDTGVEFVACGVWRDRRPFSGLAGLLDWRLAGKLSRLARDGYLVGELGEALFLPGRPRTPFDKVLVLGLGARESFGPASFDAALDRLVASLEGLRVRRAVVELPGRADGAFDAETAAQRVLDRVGDAPAHDAWWLVEDAESETRIARHALEERRRARTG
jgi:hypothetical protein